MSQLSFQFQMQPGSEDAIIIRGSSYSNFENDCRGPFTCLECRITQSSVQYSVYWSKVFCLDSVLKQWKRFKIDQYRIIAFADYDVVTESLKTNVGDSVSLQSHIWTPYANAGLLLSPSRRKMNHLVSHWIRNGRNSNFTTDDQTVLLSMIERREIDVEIFKHGVLAEHFYGNRNKSMLWERSLIAESRRVPFKYLPYIYTEILLISGQTYFNLLGKKSFKLNLFIQSLFFGKYLFECLKVNYIRSTCERFGLLSSRIGKEARVLVRDYLRDRWIYRSRGKLYFREESVICEIFEQDVHPLRSWIIYEKYGITPNNLSHVRLLISVNTVYGIILNLLFGSTAGIWFFEAIRLVRFLLRSVKKKNCGCSVRRTESTIPQNSVNVDTLSPQHLILI